MTFKIYETILGCRSLYEIQDILVDLKMEHETSCRSLYEIRRGNLLIRDLLSNGCRSLYEIPLGKCSKQSLFNVAVLFMRFFKRWRWKYVGLELLELPFSLWDSAGTYTVKAVAEKLPFSLWDSKYLLETGYFEEVKGCRSLYEILGINIIYWIDVKVRCRSLYEIP